MEFRSLYYLPFASSFAAARLPAGAGALSPPICRTRFAAARLPAFDRSAPSGTPCRTHNVSFLTQ